MHSIPLLLLFIIEVLEYSNSSANDVCNYGGQLCDIHGTGNNICILDGAYGTFHNVTKYNLT